MATNESGIQGNLRRSNPRKQRRTWSVREEEVLLQGLKDAVHAGWKSENGFRTGYLLFLEGKLKEAFPGTDLRGTPHIDSKITVWKRAYGQLRTILSRSGVGWNEGEKLIEASEETWEDIFKFDGSARGLRFKPWPYFHDWIEIFGQDRATGEFVETFADLLNETTSTPLSNFDQAMDLGRDSSSRDVEYAGESTSVSQPKAGSNTKTRKRKSLHEDDLAIVTAFNNFAESTRATMVEFMATLGKQTRSITDLNAVLEALDQVPGLTVTERVEVAEILADHPTKSELFFKLAGEARLCFVRRLLNNSR